MTVRLLFVGLVVLAGCAPPAGEPCYIDGRLLDLDVDGRFLDLDVAATDEWRLGGLPLWTTPDAAIRMYGPSDETPGDTTLWELEDVGSVLSPQFNFIGDTLAYPFIASLEDRPLVTDRGTLRFGDPARRLDEMFPRSAVCSDSTAWTWPGSDLDPEERVFIIADSMRRASVQFLIRDETILAVGIDGYEGWGRAHREGRR